MAAVEQSPDDESKSEAQRVYHELNGFERDLMIVIAGSEEPHGLAIKDELEAYYFEAYDSEELNHGRLYPNLDKLVAKDMLQKGEADGRTNWYRITEWGQEVLDARTGIRDRDGGEVA